MSKSFGILSVTTYILIPVINKNKDIWLKSLKITEEVCHMCPSFGKTFGDRSFQAAAPYLWNRLPHEIRMIKCLDKFKKAIKTFLFNEAFCNH